MRLSGPDGIEALYETAAGEERFAFAPGELEVQAFYNQIKHIHSYRIHKGEQLREEVF